MAFQYSEPESPCNTFLIVIHSGPRGPTNRIELAALKVAGQLRPIFLLKKPNAPNYVPVEQP